MLLQKGREGAFTVGLPSQSNFNLKITILTCDDYEFILITISFFQAQIQSLSSLSRLEMASVNKKLLNLRKGFRDKTFN